MSLEIFTCAQNSPDWFRCRMGLPSASMFKTVLAKGRDGGKSSTRKDYLFRLAGEIISGEPAETYSNADMQRGHEMEPDARSWYQFVHDAPLTQVGFIKNGCKGGSPDSLVGTEGLLEIKTAKPSVLAEYLHQGTFPSEHVAQAQGNLWVSERNWLDIVIYWPSMPKFMKRIFRDENYIANLSTAVDTFNAELQEIVAHIKAKVA